MPPSVAEWMAILATLSPRRVKSSRRWLELKPWETTGMQVVQAESELASIYMVYGAAGAGKRAMTSSSSPGIALMQEGITYMAGAEVPGVFVNVQRGGPGLGTIQPSQGDYFQATRGGGNGDYNVIVLAPNSVQEMADFVDLAFELAFKYRNPAMILSDGVIGQMMEKVVLPPFKPRRTDEEVIKQCPWASTGKPKNREREVITSLELKPEAMEKPATCPAGASMPQDSGERGALRAAADGRCRVCDSGLWLGSPYCGEGYRASSRRRPQR